MYLVLACGNPLREDDGVAWRVAEALGSPGEGIEVRTIQELGPELAEEVAEAEGVVFVDAREGKPPGSVWCEALAASVITNGFTHALDPPTLLLLAERLYDGAPPAALVSISGERFGHGERISPRVARSVPQAVSWVRRILAGWRGQVPSWPVSSSSTRPLRSSTPDPTA